MTKRTGASWIVYVLGALCAGAIVAAVLLVGPASSSTATITRTATVSRGVVQSTVSGSGNLQAASQLNLGFKTSGTVTHIYVAQGQHVTQGQLIATLDPQSAEVTLEQAKASLQSAEANLAKEQETDGEGSTAAGSNGSGAGNASTASTASVGSQARVTTAAYAPTQPASTGTTTPTTTVSATTAPTSTTPAATTPANTTPATGTSPTTTTPDKHTTSTTTKTNSTGKGASTTREGESKESSSGASSSKSSISTATREANLASAKAAVRSDTLTVQSDEQAVQDTRLYAPESGTIVSLSGQEGEVVSGSGTTKASTGSSSSGSTASSTGAAAAGRSSTGSSASSSSGGSSSSSFAVLSDLSSMQLVVALSESEIGSVKDGQIATVTVEALNGSKLAAHVREVALLSTSSSGAVSYDVTFQLDQLAAGLKIGMSATAEVVVKQAEGINVPTSAITADEVTVERGGKQVRQRVVTGLAGNTSTIVLSGLEAGETVVLPAASTSSSSATNVLSKLGSRLGGAGVGAGGLGGVGGGGAFFRGGG
jgi:multidrug efflux pump subunit AcrA (membrane-fusion protein)